MADQQPDSLPNSTPSPQPPADLPEGHIHLRVRVPHGNLPASVTASTFSLGAVQITSRIGDVRRQIQQIVPTNPATTRQRLLYGGRSLYDDAETVQDALNTRRSPEQREYVIHLIVRPEAGAENRTTSPARVHGQAPSNAQQVHQNAMQQHQHIHQRVHQQHLAQAQQLPIPPFMMPGMQGQPRMPPQVPMVAGAPPHMLPFDPAAFQRFQMEQAHANGRYPGVQAPPNGTNDGTTTSVSAPPPSTETQTQETPVVPQQAEVLPRPQSEPPAQANEAESIAAQIEQQRPRHGDGNLRAEMRGPDGEVWEYTEQVTRLPQQANQAQLQQQGHQHGNGGFRGQVRGPNGEIVDYTQQNFHFPGGEHPGHSGVYTVTRHPLAQASLAPQFANPPHIGPPGWVPGMPAIMGIPQTQVPHIPMPQMAMPTQGPWTPEQMLQMAQQRAGGIAPTMGDRRAPPGTSALDQARRNIAEMRRMLDELRARAQNAGSTLDSDANRQTLEQIGQLEQRMRDVQGYVDPFGVGVGGNAQNAANSNATAGSTAPAGTTAANNGRARIRLPSERLPRFSSLNLPQQPNQPTNPQDITAYLLSSPNGPQAILYSPQHGMYTSALQPTPTSLEPRRPAPPPPQQQQPQDQAQPDPAAQAAAHRFIQDVAAQRLAGAQAIAAGRDPAMQDQLGPLQQLLGHFWLLLRILIFAYFLLGSDMGYTRMLTLAAIGFGFWAVRLGVFGNQEIMDRARRWWEGVMGLPERPRNQLAGQQAQQIPGQAAQQVPPEQQPPQQQPPQQRMPTPEEVAQRLLNENADQNRGWLREQIRPVERAVALFVASLWPGIGEAHVRAQRELREREQREAQEAEVDARRKAEEESVENQKEGEGSVNGGRAEKMETGPEGTSEASKTEAPTDS